MKNLLQSCLWLALVLTAAPLFAQDYNLQFRGSLEYPGQTLANICGYAQGGREYALLGASKGLQIVDVTNPDVPVNIVQIPGPDNLWKEIKTYSHYAYITSEGGQGVQIVDLSSLPSASVVSHFYTGDGEIAGQLNTIHALHIDVKKGFLYAFGSSLFNGGAVVLDLNTDPYNPTYAGKFDQLGYVHDGYADNDTLYAGHIYTGFLSITDMTDKSNPVLLGTTQTPAKFTHNTWLLDDHKHILTTDEKVPSFVTSYDISNPADIKELDRVSTTQDGLSSIGHNTHVRNDWAITSWYTDGVTIVDAHKPDNLVQVARYDTWPAPLDGDFFKGCWGAYPFLPSGNILLSNIPVTGGAATGKLFVLTPTYVRAAYLEGKITNGCTNTPLIGATIQINSSDANNSDLSKNNGEFKMGQVTPGNFTVTVSKTGFISQTFNITLVTTQVTPLNVTLEPESGFSVAGIVVEASVLQPIANAPVTLVGPTQTYQVQTNASGQFNLECVESGAYTVVAGQWGYLPGTAIVAANGSVTVEIGRGYYDDFLLDLGWTNSSNASSGDWIRDEPVGTFNNNEYANPEQDVLFDGNDKCYITGNEGGGAGSDDIDNGSVTLTTPEMKLADYQDGILSFWYWFYNGGGNGGTPNDKLVVEAISNGQTVPVFTQTVSQSGWRFSGDIHLKDFVAMSDNVQVQFVAADDAPGHVVEAGVDVFQVIPTGFSSVQPDLVSDAKLLISPNPSATEFAVRYSWPTVENVTLEVRNLLGQVVTTQVLSADSGMVQVGAAWPQGVYLLSLRSATRQGVAVKAVKQ